MHLEYATFPIAHLFSNLPLRTISSTTLAPSPPSPFKYNRFQFQYKLEPIHISGANGALTMSNCARENIKTWSDYWETVHFRLRPYRPIHGRFVAAPFVDSPFSVCVAHGPHDCRTSECHRWAAFR